jgi:ABC-2 type transport system permease protein
VVTTAWIVMRNDLLRRWRSPLAAVVYLLFPFVFSGLIALAFGTGGEARVPRFQVALVDLDGGFVARFVSEALAQEQVAQYLETRQVTEEEAIRLIEDNQVSGAIVIPEDFSDAVLEGRATQLRVVRNPAQSIGPVAVEEAAGMIALLVAGAATVPSEPLAELLRTLDEGQSSEDHFPSAGRFAFPPVIRLAKDDAAADSTAADPDAGGRRQFLLIFSFVLPGMATFALLILSLGFMADVPRELSRGTLQRQLAAPVRASGVVLGKMFSCAIMGLIISAAMALVGALMLGVRADLAAFVLLCLAFVLASTGFLTFVFSIVRSEAQGATLASIVIMVMSFLGGSWIPLDSLPPFVEKLAHGTLNYWGIRGFRTLILTDAGVAEIAVPLLVLLVTGVVTSLVGSWAMHRRLMQGV